MRRIFTFILLFAISATQIFAQQADSVTMSPGYAQDIYYSLENGEVSAIAGNEWTIAFSTPMASASARTNDGRGITLYETNVAVADFTNAIDTSNTSSLTKLYNQYDAWANGAFNVNATGHPNYGWGNYSMSTHVVTGNKVYIVAVSGGNWYKTYIEEKRLGTWKIRYATIGNGMDTTVSVPASDLQTKNFSYLNMTNHTVLDREPAKTDWDILFTKYNENLPPPRGRYNVTGVLANEGIEILEINNTAHNDATHSNQTFSTDINTIGYDWKQFNMSTYQYVIDDSTTFFVKNAKGDIYKLYFTAFEGSSTGKIIFNKEKVFTASPTDPTNPTDPNAINNLEGINVVELYPNPSSTQANIVFDATQSEVLSYTIYNTMGKMMTNAQITTTIGLNAINLDVSNYENGIYFITLSKNGKTQNLKLSVAK